LFTVKDGKSLPSATYGRGIFAGVDENRFGHLASNPAKQTADRPAGL
jgi:hypothetical protein